MAVYDTIVVGTDGSQTACRALHKAALYAQRMGVPLTIATVWQRPDETEGGPASAQAERREALGAFAYHHAADLATDAIGYVRERVSGVQIATAVREGDPAEQLIESAAGNALLVVGNKGMTGSKRFLLGSVPNKISHHAQGDLLIARTTAAGAIKLPQRILIATDGSVTAARAVRRGLDVAAAIGAEVTALFVGPARHGEAVMADVVEQAAESKVAVTADVRGGDPADQIVDAGATHDLLVVGNKGMTGPARFLLGSVPNKVSHHVDTDLLIVRTVLR